MLAGRDPEASLSIASTTKLMTAYVARRELGLSKVVVAPDYVPISSAESLLGLVPGERIEVRDLLYGLLLASGNDAANALAVASAGSVEKFVAEMNRAAAKLGLEDTHYANPIGLDDPGNYSSARDLVDLTAVLRRDRVFREIFDSPSATLDSGAETRTVENRNQLVLTTPFVNGVKTGYTIDAGNVLVSSGKRGGQELIAAVLGEATESGRDADSLALLEYGFSLYRREQVVERRERVASATVADQDLTLELVAAEPVSVEVRKGQSVATDVDAPRQVEGPITRNEPLGIAIVRVDGDARARTPLLAATAVPAASIGDRIDAAVPGSSLLAWVLFTALLAGLAILVIRWRAR